MYVLCCRYPPHGRRPIAIECGVPRERLRAAAVDTSPHDLHISDCLNDLHPGDHIEIQWRRNKEFPYGMFYSHIYIYIKPIKIMLINLSTLNCDCWKVVKNRGGCAKEIIQNADPFQHNLIAL